MIALRYLLAGVLAAGVVGVAADDPTGSAVLNEEIEVIHAERMIYPLPARVHVVEGAVVIKVELEKTGKVRSASAVSGPKLLIDDCIKNAKNWVFRRTAAGTAVIVYFFQIKGLCELPCPSNFEYYAPNVAIISMGRPLVMPAASR
jgi:hypothetical protein